MLLSLMTMSVIGISGVIGSIARSAKQMTPLPGSAPTTTSAPLTLLEVTERAAPGRSGHRCPCAICTRARSLCCNGPLNTLSTPVAEPCIELLANRLSEQVMVFGCRAEFQATPLADHASHNTCYRYEQPSLGNHLMTAFSPHEALASLHLFAPSALDPHNTWIAVDVALLEKRAHDCWVSFHGRLFRSPWLALQAHVITHRQGLELRFETLTFA